MGQDRKRPKGADTIDANLRRVYLDALNEAVPDRFVALLDQLRAQDAAAGTAPQTGQAQTDQTQTDQTQTDQAQTGQAQTGQAQTGQAQTGQAQTDQAKTGQAQPNQAQPRQSHTNPAQSPGSPKSTGRGPK